MCTSVQSKFFLPPEPFEAAPSKEGNGAITDIAGKVLAHKEAGVKESLGNTWKRYNPILIGGDLFTMGDFVFQSAQTAKPAIQGIAAVAVASVVFGIVGGLINIGVGIVSLPEAIQAFRNGDFWGGMRLLLDFFFLTAIGSVMFLASLGVVVGALGGIGAFFTSNPWVLPVLFLVITIPLFIEIGARILKIGTGTDLASRVETLFQNHFDNPNENKAEKFKEWCLSLIGDFEGDFKPEHVIEAMEKCQAQMGVEAAVETMGVWHELLSDQIEKAAKRFEALKKRIREWNWAQLVRMIQQIIFIVGFIISMGALKPTKSVNAAALNVSNPVLMAGGNFVPLLMDIFWPFKRNTPIVVPKMELEVTPK